MKIKVFFLALILFPIQAMAFSPVARVDVVPYQRIEYGTSFNFGVIAFSKPGISSVVFTIAGQGYSSGTKTATTMTLNSRVDVWEYWVEIPSSEFTSNGAITITVAVTDNDLNVRNLTAIPMIVEATQAYSHYEAWVDIDGSDGTGTVGDDTDPFPSIQSAITAAQTANSGSSDGNIIYLVDDVYSFSGLTASTTSEWVTIKGATGSTKENIIVNAGAMTTSLFKIESLTLQSQGDSQYVLTDSSTSAWVNDCRLIGSGMWVTNTNPVHHNTDTHYSTDNYIYDADYGYRQSALVRGVDMVDIGNDGFENGSFVINCTLTNLDNGSTGWHADAFQTHTTGAPAPSNKIVYGYKATDLHYQGVFMRSDVSTAQDNAFVNMLIEMREPSSPEYVFVPLGISNDWDHLIMWNCTFPLGQGYFSDTSTNASVVGNVFWQIAMNDGDIGDPVLDFAAPGNAGNNEFVENHFMYVYNVTGSCTQTSADVANGSPCPSLYAKRPDSDAGVSSTVGGGVLDISFKPDDAALIGRFTSVVPVDIDGNERGVTSDVGAYEYQIPPTYSPNGSVPKRN